MPLVLTALFLLLPEGAGAQPEPVTAPYNAWDLNALLDHLPRLHSLGIPGMDPDSPFRLHVEPRLGDLYRRDYLRVLMGSQVVFSEHTDARVELEGYVPHGLKGSSGYGLSRLLVGAKRDRILSEVHPTGWTVGLDFSTPLSRPPLELSDGCRHTLPYLALTREIVPAWRLVGYSGLGADLLSKTDLPVHFGRNQLHENSLTLGAGITRSWLRFQAALTASWGDSAWLSNENHSVFILAPEVLVPLIRETGSNLRTHLLLKVGARAVWGPDGQEFGVTSALRIIFAAKR